MMEILIRLWLEVEAIAIIDFCNNLYYFRLSVVLECYCHG
jgi:hypothetical protein